MALTSISTTKVGSASMNENSETRKSAKARQKAQNGTAKNGGKRNITQSSSFMDALAAPAGSEKKKSRMGAIEKKRRRSSEEDLLGGIYSKMNKMHEGTSFEPVNHYAPSKSPVPELKSTTPPPERVTKIKFADDHGHPLVSVRYFEVEEGERVNVNSLSHEQIRAMEVQMEKKAVGKMSPQKEGKVEMLDTDEVADVKPINGEANNGKPWRVVALADLPARSYGTKSLEAKTEEKRQQKALKAFYMPGRHVNRFEEPALVDCRGSDRHKVKLIPLNLPVPQSQQQQQAAQSPVIATPSTINATATHPPPSSNGPIYSPAIGVHVDPATPSTSAPATATVTTKTTGNAAPSTAAATLLGTPERSKILDLLSNLKKTGILQSSGQQPVLPPAQTPIYAQAQQPTYQQEFYLPPVTAASTMPPTMQQHPVGGYMAEAPLRFSVPPPSTAAISTPHAYIATMQPTPSTPHFSSHNAPALPVTSNHDSFNRMPTVVPPPPRNFEQPHDRYNGPVKPRGPFNPFNGPVMGGYRQCRAYGAPGGCSFGDRCRYAHGDQPPPAAAGVRRNAARNEAASAPVGTRL